MKIALVVPGGVDRSGEFRVVPVLLALLRGLSQRHEVHVYALRQETERADWPLCGTQVHNIGGRGGAVGLVRAVGAIAAEHRRGPFALVQAIWSGSSGLVAVASARWLGLPSLVHPTGIELLALRDIGYGGRLRWRGRLRERLVLRSASLLSTTSAPMQALMASLGLDARRIPLGVDVQEWPPQAPRARERSESLRLIHVASLNWVKDQTLLLHALASLQRRGLDFHLDIVGEDTLGGRIQALAAHLGLARRVGFRGFMTQTQLRPLLAEAHLHLVSSRHEAGPVTALEAALLGVPSVGTHVGHLAEWAAHEPPAALTVAPGDALALAETIARLHADDALRVRLAEAAQQMALKEDARHSVSLFERLYADVVEDGRC